ncbi:hypothetical protein FGO68_gene12729 [Halteria grandinella]|uniref:Uncharacterized protein n=1 Tax=Halteria grandinella TaxID=5974 RepID=A0A8J8T8D8_HALGN|nr:hypothetical protein FGO68_gene12729 [Halteria grandinella]
MRQLMNLKTKGRFLDETLHFVEVMKTAPSRESQKKVLNQISQQMYDVQDTVQERLTHADTIKRKNQIVNQRLNCELFYFNPVYKELLKKRNINLRRNSLAYALLRNHQTEKRKSQIFEFQKIVNATVALEQRLPSLSQTVSYKRIDRFKRQRMQNMMFKLKKQGSQQQGRKKGKAQLEIIPE